ncbi:MAG: histone deacetylase [Deltaproteobacteria bacterium]|nr:histone deacetylase [Deltaproteobacteria bacterium]
METGLLYDDAFLDHRAQDTHPEQPARLTVMWRALQEAGLTNTCRRIPARMATREEILLVHEATYLQHIERIVPGQTGYLDPDTFFSPGTWNAALLAAGGTIDMALGAIHDGPSTGFALVRPPGHHATADDAMGFCLLNNVALAAAAALKDGTERVAIIDWDIHHGNGTQDIFYQSDRVLYTSFHLYPHYPGTGRHQDLGRAKGQGYTINFPMPQGAGLPEFATAFHQVLSPVLRQFHPDLILISTGFDSHRQDPLGGLRLETDHYRALTEQVLLLARNLCSGRVVTVLEGGYNLDILGDCAVATVSGMMEPDPKPLAQPTGNLVRGVAAMIDELAGLLRRQGWSL